MAGETLPPGTDVSVLGVGVFVRFLAFVLMVTLVSVVEISLQQKTLQRKRQISLIYQDLDQLAEKRAQLFLLTEQLGAPPVLHREMVRRSMDGSSTTSRHRIAESADSWR